VPTPPEANRIPISSLTTFASHLHCRGRRRHIQSQQDSIGRGVPIESSLLAAAATVATLKTFQCFSSDDYGYETHCHSIANTSRSNPENTTIVTRIGRRGLIAKNNILQARERGKMFHFSSAVICFIVLYFVIPKYTFLNAIR